MSSCASPSVVGVFVPEAAENLIGLSGLESRWAKAEPNSCATYMRKNEARSSQASIAGPTCLRADESSGRAVAGTAHSSWAGPWPQFYNCDYPGSNQVTTRSQWRQKGLCEGQTVQIWLQKLVCAATYFLK